MKLVWFVLVAVVVLVIGAVVWRGQQVAPDELDRLIGVLPPTVEGWQSVGDDLVLSRGDMELELGEGASAYVAHGLRSGLVRRWVREMGEPELVLRVLLMDSPEGARVAFAANARGEPVDVGQEAVLAPGELLLREGPFVATFEIPAGGEIDRASLLSLARAVAAAGREASS